ncbi:META domain-containing protein [Shimia gijangensis]|uniref:META domain-containing protein n=1 Tax=Shimia gijangensis TaxID=1470563 RepID=UPI001FE7DF3D|nr:META domain-containing protein [Shimia gijangensis]
MAGYDGEKLWILTEIDGVEFAARATLLFGEDNKVTGQAPCNSFFTKQTKPYPWIGFDPIGSTRMACPEMNKETLFFNTLGKMTLAEVSGDVMILSNDSGRQMVFKAAPTDG